MKRSLLRSLVCALALATALPGGALEVPRELKLLQKPQLSMLCSLQLANLAVLAQREPTGDEDEALRQSAYLFQLTATWLPHSAGVSPEEQDRLAYVVVGQSFSELKPQAAYCAQQAREMLASLPAEIRAELTGHGMTQALRLREEVVAGR